MVIPIMPEPMILPEIKLPFTVPLYVYESDPYPPIFTEAVRLKLLPVWVCEIIVWAFTPPPLVFIFTVGSMTSPLLFTENCIGESAAKL